MPKFRCVTEGCSLEGEVKTFAKVRYVFDEKLSKLVPTTDIRCPDCGKELDYVSSEGVPKISINKFDGLPSHEKRKVIQKRSMDHFKKNDKGDLANYKQKIIDDNKRMVQGK